VPPPSTSFEAILSSLVCNIYTIIHIMFIIGRSAPEYTSYSTYLPSMPGLHRPRPASYYPDDSTFDHASLDLDAEWLALERAQQYAHAQERAVHQAQQRAYLAEVARVRAREVAQHRMRVEQEELARARAAYRNTLLRDLVSILSIINFTLTH
jgi:hypothetical protein